MLLNVINGCSSQKSQNEREEKRKLKIKNKSAGRQIEYNHWNILYVYIHMYPPTQTHTYRGDERRVNQAVLGRLLYKPIS